MLTLIIRVNEKSDRLTTFFSCADGQRLYKESITTQRSRRNEACTDPRAAQQHQRQYLRRDGHHHGSRPQGRQEEPDEGPCHQAHHGQPRSALHQPQGLQEYGQPPPRGRGQGCQLRARCAALGHSCRGQPADRAQR